VKLEANNYDSTMRTIGSLARSSLHEAHARSEGVDPLKGHPGRSPDILRHGRPRFEAHVERITSLPADAAAWSSLEAEFERGQRLCESPIERNMLAALVTGDWPVCRSLFPAIHNAKDFSEAFPRNEVVIVPQMALLRFRLDLGLVVGRMDRRPLIVGIECDGKDFHQDGQKDRERDAYFSAIGVRVIRLSGRALNFEPIAVADAIIDGIEQWLAA
jgi:hypothetical protein